MCDGCLRVWWSLFACLTLAFGLLLQGSYECVICLMGVARADPVWTCRCCWRVLHLACVSTWRTSSGATRAGAGDAVMGVVVIPSAALFCPFFCMVWFRGVVSELGGLTLVPLTDDP